MTTPTPPGTPQPGEDLRVPALQAGADPQPRRARMSVGAWIGIAVGAVAILAVGIAGPFAGYRWGYALGENLPVVESATPSDGSDGAGDGSAAVISGDLPLMTDVDIETTPTLNAEVPEHWSSNGSDGSVDQYIDDATQCLLAIDHGESIQVADGWTDASATGYAIDGYAGSIRTDDAYKDVDQSRLVSDWVDANDGAGRVQFMTAMIYYSDVDDTDVYRTFVVARVFEKPAWMVAAYLDCPSAATNTDQARLQREVLASLSLVG